MPRRSNRCHGVTRGGERCSKDASGGAFCAQHPLPGGLVTPSGFADLEGVTPQMVSKWLAEIDGLEKTADGFIEWEKAQRLIEETRDYSRPLQREGDRHEAPDIDDLEDIHPKEVQHRYELARMLKEEERARLAEIERREKEGELIDARAVAHDFADMFSMLRQSFRTMPDRVAGRLYSAESPREIRDILRDEIHDCLSDIADRLEEMADDDEPELQAAE